MTMRKAAVLLAILAAGCPHKEDPTPQIPVTPGAAKVLDLIPSKSGKPRSPNAARARVHRMPEGGALGGPNATGKTGDWVLENDEVVFVVDALGESAGFSESGGNVVDAADARGRKDELGQLFTYFGTFPRQGVYTSMDTKEESDGSAWIESRGKELWDPALSVVTRLTLAAGDRALLLETTLTNTGAAKTTLPSVGDVVHWGGAEKIAPGKPLAFRGPSKGPYLGGLGRFVSYAITSTDGEVTAMSGGAWSNTDQQKDVEIAPQASFTYKRVFVVGERPDSASVVAELTRASAGDLGTLAVSLTDETGKRIVVPRGARAVLGTTPTDEVLGVVATNDGDAVLADVPPGKWFVGFSPSVGRRATSAPRIAVVVEKGKTHPVALATTAPHSVTFGPCEEAGTKIPCKLTIEALAGGTVPDLGPGHAAGPAKNQMTLGPGEAIALPFPAGQYRITASRGLEYDVKSVDITVPGPAPGAMQLRRVVDTKGYVGGDFHQHTILSVDAATSQRDRVLANAAEGVEVAVASEHNVIAGFQPIAKELGVDRFFVSITGLEVTTDAGRTPWGHANVYPLEEDTKKPRGGAPVVRDRTPKEVFAELRARPGARVFQINHPRSPRIGYFDAMGFDATTGAGTNPAYEAGFDAVEVWSARHIDGRAKVLVDYFALLRASRPTTPIASTDTHGIVGQEPGLPRTFVRVAKDDALDTWDDARSRDLVRGVKDARDVVLTNGPFLSLTANGAGIGGLARARAGSVDIAVKVVCAPWIEVEKLEVRTVRGESKEIALAPKRDGTGAFVAEARVAMRFAADDAFVVIASGKKPMRPIYAGTDAEIAPWAMSGAVWVDGDGDGKSLGVSARAP